MPLRTKIFQQLPWNGGVNSSKNTGVIGPDQLVTANNIVIDESLSRKKRDGVDMDFDSQANGSDRLIRLHDTFFGATSTKTHRIAAIADDRNVYEYTESGTRTTLALDAGATAWTGTPTQASTAMMNNLLIMATDTSADVLHKWAGTGNDIFDLGGTPPLASILREHISRLWTNDQVAIDRLHYCETGNPELWNGSGDSGALDIGIGDGDKGGITAIFPTFNGDLYVAKRRKLYRIRGFHPELFQVQLVSDGIGCISHNAVVATDNDIIFVSERGVHSLVATQKFGDIEKTFVSRDIQGAFKNDFVFARLKHIQLAYSRPINSVAMVVTDARVDDTSLFSGASVSSVNNSVWLFNTELLQWYRGFDSMPCESVVTAADADTERFYFGTFNTRLIQTENSSLSDIDFAGATRAIKYKIKSGKIFPDGNPSTLKGFKKFAPIFAPPGVFEVKITVDNAPAQTISYNEPGGDTLDETFILDQSLLGGDADMAPYARTIDGYGRGATIEVNLTTAGENVDIQGYAFEFEDADIEDEVRT